METSPHNKNKTEKQGKKMKQKNRLTTEVTYWRGEGSQAERVSARKTRINIEFLKKALSP